MIKENAYSYDCIFFINLQDNKPFLLSNKSLYNIFKYKSIV